VDSDRAGALGLHVSYDYEGDGVWDRREIYIPFTVDNVVNKFQVWNGIGTGVGTNLAKAPSGGWKNLTGGQIRIQLWQATAVSGAMKVRSDAITTQQQLSSFQFPFNTFSYDAKTC
jgi:hypothetical protein